ncbi:MAG: acetyl-CoA carboxylase biotin carboxyl carrier protein subunit, partial [Anaerolineae bacterium]|nr:acetyl-CoA carboxylase biotin carboxyl carrier protein subunit [Anaerolineae bacterium]
MPVYHVTIGEKTYTVEISNPHERPVRAIVDGEPIEVEIAASPGATAHTPVETTPTGMIPTPQPAATAMTAAAAGDITSPLPGVVTTISVKIGDKVTPGQELCILEAMKMNNPIRATMNGTVTAIHVSVGQQVQYG